MMLFLRLAITVVGFLGLSANAFAGPTAPTNFVAAGMSRPSGGATFAFSWTDKSNNETQWVIEGSFNNGPWSIVGSIGSTSTSATGGTQSTWWDNPGGVLGASYSFRVYAYNGTYSTASNIASVTPASFPVTASLVPNQTAVNLSWPSVQNAGGYEIWRVVPGSTPDIYIKTVAGSATSAQITAPDIAAGNTYDFVVQPILGNSYVGTSSVVNIAVNVITSKTGTSGTAGSAFSHTFTQTTVPSVTSRSLTGLPSGLSFNSNTGLLSGIYPAIGNYTLVYKVNLSNGTQLTQSFSIRVRPAAGAPLVAEAIPAWSGMAGESRETDLMASFSDPEAESAVRVSTTLGDMDFILFDSATPATVTNFMNYVNSGKYTNVAFHRSISDFVIQSGGFAGTGTGSNFTSMVTNAPVVNEPGIANVRGTVSMAKLGGDADSATSQFFVSTDDNQSNLDYQNGGFTVFGRVAGNGMAVADAINDLPTRTYQLYVDGSGTAAAFTDFPMNAASAPVSMDQTKLVKINSVTPVSTMSFSISGNTNPSVASASVVGGQLHIEGLSGGLTTITVTATDLDNLTTNQTVDVELTDTYAAWVARNELSGEQSGGLQNPDGDGLNNLLEYAFLEDPEVPSQGPLPIVGKIEVSPSEEFMTLTFPVRKFTDGLNYVVEGSDALGGPWAEVWASADGFSHSQVLEAVDLADRTEVKIQDTVAIGAQLKRFLRVRIVQE